MEEKLVTVLNEMADYLSVSQMKNFRKYYSRHLPKTNRNRNR